MPHEAERYLYDIFDACSRIVSYAAGLTLDTYRNDPKTRDAVERCLEIVGEALRQLLQQHPSLSNLFPEANQAIGLRNILAHGYGDIEDERVCLVVTLKVPDLLSRTAAELERRQVQKGHP